MRNSTALFTGALLLASCSIEEVLDVDPVASIEVSAPYSAISPGEVHQLRALLRDVEGSDLGPRATRWSSLDPGIATVDGEGKVTGVAVGTARLVGRSEGRSDTLELPVRSTWARIWAGSRLICAERIAGGTYCWGDGPGDGTAETRYSPVPLSGISTLRSIQRVQIGAACGLAPTGAYYCWDTSTYFPDIYGNGSDSTHGPTPYQGASGLLLKSFGNYYGTCGAGLDGKGWCWGQVFYGVDTSVQFNYLAAPDTIRGGISWRTLQPGEWGTCGLDMGGAPYCFGLAYALLGQGDTPVKRRLPTPVVGGHTFDSLYVRGRSACGLKSNGEAWCWGEGAIGNGGAYGTYGTPALVVGDHHFRVLRPGLTTSYCGIELDGSIWCWGSTPVRMETPFPFVDFATGSNFCGLTAGGGVYCRGSVLLGDGSKGPSDTFVRVQDPE